MPYLIDGHNLIPKVGLRLDSVDDELELIMALQEYSRKSRKGIEVYFDGAPPGNSGSRRFGQVSAHFIGKHSSADAAIRARLGRLGRAARNWTVVSTDREVQSYARAARAGVETSDQFAERMRQAQRSDRGERRAGDPAVDGEISDAEVKHWLELFKKR